MLSGQPLGILTSGVFRGYETKVSAAEEPKKNLSRFPDFVRRIFGLGRDPKLQIEIRNCVSSQDSSLI
jgi:hypothetical protein